MAMKQKGSTSGMSGMGDKAKKSKDMPPSMYGGRAHSAMGGGSEKPRRGYASTGGRSYNGNCK